VTAASSWAFRVDPVESWTYADRVFTPEECRRIIAIGEKKIAADGAVSTAGQRNAAIRDSRIAWLHPEDEMEWVYRKVTDTVMAANDRFFGFDVFGLLEGFQFTRYDAPSGFYGLHIDKATGGPVRKLSLTLQLSAPEDYDGGELALQIGAEPQAMEREQGQMVLFPSYVLHEVRPVTRGRRYSLVAWVAGAPFR
jgi:PKHD-type hydroxylase